MKKTILEYSISVGVCLILAFLICVIGGIFSYTEKFRIYGLLCDGFFISGIFAFSVGILIFVHNNGIFDMLIYGMMRFISLFKKNPKQNKYETFYDYSVAKAERPKAEYAFLLIVGGAFILISLLFLFIWAKESGNL